MARLAREQCYIITSLMSQSPPASAPTHDHAHSHEAARVPRPLSALRLSGGDRLLGVAIVAAALWAGVYWALH